MRQVVMTATAGRGRIRLEVLLDGKLDYSVTAHLRSDRRGVWRTYRADVDGGREPLTSARMRGVRLDKIEAMARDQEIADLLTWGPEDRLEATWMTELDIPEPFLATVFGGQHAPSVHELEPLEVPTGRVDADFLHKVAQRYQAEVAAGRPPAPTIAAELHVSPRTVHAWVRRARAAGYLPAGVRGRVG